MISLFVKHKELASSSELDWFVESLFGTETPFVTISTKKNKNLFAVTDGFLSVVPSELMSFFPEGIEIENVTTQDFPDTINVELSIRPRLLRAESDFEIINKDFHVYSFTYRNIDTLSFIEQVGELVIDKAVKGTDTMTFNEKFNLFLEGYIKIPIKEGSSIGKAFRNENLDRSICHFSCNSNIGPIDPALFYTEFSTLIKDVKDIDLRSSFLSNEFLRIGISEENKASFLLKTELTILPFAYLNAYKVFFNLTYKEWRNIGNQQKQIYIERLKSRAGIAADGTFPIHFEFNSNDRKNIFQLEAITEFYANFPEQDQVDKTYPAYTGASYIKVNFLPIEGNKLTIEGNRITIEDDDIDIRDFLHRNQVNGNYVFKEGLQGLIEIEEDTVRASRTYQLDVLKSKENKRFTLKLKINETGPQFNIGITQSKWKYTPKSTLVTIDPLGARIKGNQAKIIATVDGDKTILELADIKLKDLKINKDFDTIYLPNDMARNTKRYRIIRGAYRGETVNKYRHRKYKNGTVEISDLPSTDGIITGLPNKSKKIIVEGLPNFGTNAQSRWEIPGGLGGYIHHSQNNISSQLLKLGYDMYEGICFLIYNGQIIYYDKITSYTSRKYPLEGNLQGKNHDSNSSIQGNQLYYYFSFLSSSTSRNYSLKVCDNPGKIDKCRKSKRYFQYEVEGDDKGLIRIHHGYGKKGGTGTGSAGCQVSPWYFRFRNELIRIYMIEKRLTMGDSKVFKHLIVDKINTARKIWKNTHSTTTGKAKITRSQFRNKINGQYWLIRPDERLVDNNT